MDETFHLRTYHRNFALIGILCSVILTVAASLWIALTDAAENEPPFVIFFPLFPLLFFGGISSWLLLIYMRALLTLRNGQLVQQGVFRRKRIELRDVVQLRWIGGVVLLSGADRLRIDLQHFTAEQQLRIIRHLRRTVPLTAQSNWPKFCHLVALPLTRRDEPTIPKEGEVLISRRRIDRYMFPTTIFFVILAGIISWALSHPRFLVYPLQCIFLWILLRFATPKHGVVARRFSASPETTAILVFLLLWNAIGLAAAIGFFVFAAAFSTPALISAATVTCILWFVGLGYGLHRIDLPRQKRLEFESRTSVNEWDRLHLEGHQSF